MSSLPPTAQGGSTARPQADTPAASGTPANTGFEHLGLPQPIDPRWGQAPKDHFGYASDAERLAKRGMEDWELVTKIPASQRRVPYWFIAVVLIVLLVAVGLGFPFWGQRPGVKVQWFNWGFIAAIVYVAIAAAFVYYMTNLYGSDRAGRLDSDPANREDADVGTKSDRSGTAQ
jgi:uncharacterized membrane protein